MVSTYITMQWAKNHAHSTNVQTVSIDTLISADGWRDYVTESARAIGVRRFEIWNNPGLDLWESDIHENGFVYRKAQHKFYFYWLKQRAFRETLQHYKKYHTDRILYINGVRWAESAERRDTPEIARNGCGVYVNPIVHWTNDEVLKYRVQHELPINPFYDRVGNSGDCLCNWHNHISMSDLEQYGTHAASIIKPLDMECRTIRGYGYDDEPPKHKRLKDLEQLRLFEWDVESTPNLCAGCSKPDPSNDDQDNLFLQRLEW